MDKPYRIRRLTLDEAIAAAPALGEVLFDCTMGGASTGFMADLTLDQAVDFWRGEAKASDGRAIVAAEDDGGYSASSN